MLDLRCALRVAAAAASLLSFATAALAFSQIDPGEGGEPTAKEGIIAVPLPPLDDAPEREAQGTVEGPQPEAGPADEPAPAAAQQPAEAAPPGSSAAPPEGPPAPPADELQETPSPPAAAATGAAEPVRYGEDDLPRPVRDLRRKLMEIARTGEVEALRPYLETGSEPTVLTFGDTPHDPIAYLKEASGDGEGAELLAILLEILESGYAHAEAGSDAEIYIWPYFAQANLEALTLPQKVELFELVTAGDYEAMKSFGAYNFYRAGISPEGRLEFFVAGD